MNVKKNKSNIFGMMKTRLSIETSFLSQLIDEKEDILNTHTQHV